VIDFAAHVRKLLTASLEMIYNNYWHFFAIKMGQQGIHCLATKGINN